MAEMETFELWVSSQVPLVPGRLKKKKKRKRRSAEEGEGGREGGTFGRLEPERAERAVRLAGRGPTGAPVAAPRTGRWPENGAENIAGIPA